MTKVQKNFTYTKTYHLLIDACVASALSDPASGSLIGALKIISELHRGPVGLAMTATLRKEWMEHSSKYMLRFLARMEARRRVSNYDHKRVADFRSAIDGHVRDPGNRKAIEKDAHLTEVAILHGLAIMSLDEKQRKLLRKLAEFYNPLSTIQWFNPCQEGDSGYKWVHETPHDRSLGALVT